ncbi:MAG TPA: SIS domain-containing protein [Candidatus Cloacimonetes bacterium]|nr:SIS domain-containing protein [Candidatus Cloacimonadota bacterium]HEX38127.1 SIS domain-containing protein [Candidatus Cloacimonadota bacterium]
MNIKALFDQALEQHMSVMQDLPLYYSKIEETAGIMAGALKSGNKILLCGNGGSAADAQHIATEFIVRFRGDFNRRSLPAIALTTDTSLLTACANDYGFEEIFKRQVEGLGKPGDVLIGISTSGNSPNVYKAIDFARSNNIITILLAGKNGGSIKNIADHAIVVSHDDTARIQEAHITIGHILCRLVEEIYFNKI